MIEANVIHCAYLSRVKRLLFLGSTCIYPKAISQPMREEALLTNVLVCTNCAIAIAQQTLIFDSVCKILIVYFQVILRTLNRNSITYLAKNR